MTTIIYSAINTKYGKTLVATRGETLVSFLFLTADELKMMKLFHSHFPDAIECKNKDFTYIAESVFGEKPVKFELNGTPFQQTVWRELLKLDGVASYQELAQRIKNPNAVRAVANAVAKNLLHIIIPCHLVVKLNGEVGKYAGGVELKKRLISNFPLGKGF